ncbi:unnamed protein product [Urochloa decumbens]|uniref:protein-serine/threonine phosphatase n=1 Tax=Urochloa decumbens TaxID=240449 RepID=A0ABC8YYC9_9POAL
MGAGAEVMHQVVPLLESPYHRCVVKSVEVIEEVVAVAPAPVQLAASPKAVVEVAVEVSDLKLKRSIAESSVSAEPLQFVPSIRSGSFADIGPRRDMEDEHIRIDDLSAHVGSLLMFSAPSAFYGVFDGHGGSDAAAYMKNHAMKLFFEDAEFPQTSQEDEMFAESVEDSVRKAFLRADLALSDDSVINRSSGTTALTALVLGRQLLVANAGDCRAVLCRKGVAVEMSKDHRPTYDAERQRVIASGGYIEDGYLNGVLSVTRALGDWDMKLPHGSPSPLIAEPEICWTTLTEDDEFLIIGCDGIWDVMTSQHAVSTVRRGLRRHDDPERCARELAMEAKRLKTFDNLTVVVVCFVSELGGGSVPLEPAASNSRLRCCKSLSPEALSKLRRWLDSDE